MLLVFHASTRKHLYLSAYVIAQHDPALDSKRPKVNGNLGKDDDLEQLFGDGDADWQRQGFLVDQVTRGVSLCVPYPDRDGLAKNPKDPKSNVRKTRLLCVRCDAVTLRVL